MPRPTWTLTGPLSAPHGAVLAGTELTLSLVPGVSRDTSGSDLRAGSTVAVVGADGTLTVKGTGDPVMLLASSPDAPVHYRLSCIPRVLPTVTFTAPEGGTLALDDIVPEVPAPIPPVDASTLRAEWQAALAALVLDHGALTGLGEDDHTQYLTEARGDARYPLDTDPRLDDARTPTAHAATHAAAGSDPVSVTSAQISDLTEAVQDIVGVVSLDRYPRLGSETDDAPRFARAIADMAEDATLRVLQLGAGTYTLTSSVSVDVDGITVRGAGIRATVIRVEADVIGLHFTSCSYPTVESLTVYSSTTARTVFPVVFTDCTHPVVNNAYLNGASGARRSGVHLTGTGGVASMGLVQGSVFNHSCLLVEVDDVKLVDSWVWGMTCDYAVAVRDGSASFVASNVDIVPPFTSTATGIAGIVIGDDGSNPFNAKLMGVYLDGNPTLSTRTGIKIAPGAGGVLIKNTHANQMEAESILVDSAYNVVIEGYTSYANNRAGNGTPEILITQTGAQPVENIRIDNVQFLQTQAVVGTAGPAIKVDSSVSGSQVTVSNFDIKQPSAGGGYSVPEVSVPTSGGYPTVGMSGRGKRSVYSAIGSQAVSSGATGATITLASPYPMAYRPRPSQIMLATEGATLPQHRIQYVDDNTIYVAFATPIAAAATIHWRAVL